MLWSRVRDRYPHLTRIVTACRRINKQIHFFTGYEYHSDYEIDICYNIAQILRAVSIEMFFDCEFYWL